MMEESERRITEMYVSDTAELRDEIDRLREEIRALKAPKEQKRADGRKDSGLRHV